MFEGRIGCRSDGVPMSKAIALTSFTMTFLCFALLLLIASSDAGAAGKANPRSGSGQHAKAHPGLLLPKGIEAYSKKPSEIRPYKACPPPSKSKAKVGCDLIVVPTENGEPVANPAMEEGSGKNGGWSPADLQSAYNVSSENGEGMTVAVVVPFDHPGAEADLKTYREYYKLPACTTANGCFEKILLSEKGGGGTSDWALETSLDLDMVSSICPKCHLLLVENSLSEGGIKSIAVAVNEAAKLGADVVSVSSENVESQNYTSYDHYYDHPGIPILVASGDSAGVSYPAASPYAIAVGGTHLSKDSSSPRGWKESAWKGAGSGCSKYEPKPTWQADTGCANRAVADVSAVADAFSPVSAYSSEEIEGVAAPGWFLAGGTSAAAPIVAGIEATKNSAFREAGARSFYEAGSHHELYDVISGGNKNCLNFLFQGHYLCEAVAGYDGPSGMGTPGVPLAGPPAFALAANLLEPEEATLNGIVAPQGLSTTYVFEYGLTTTYGSSAPAEPANAGSSTNSTVVSQKITGLKPSTEYHYRVSATNSTGTFRSLDRTLTTPAKPELAAVTKAASNVQAKVATLNGAINPVGSSATYQFEYGETESYGNSVPAVPKAIGTGYSTVSQEITGLKAGKLYHVRLKATQGSTTTYGWDQTFVTTPGPPTAITEPALNIEGDMAYLKGTVQPGGEDSLYQFEYVTDTDFQSTGYAGAVKVPSLESQRKIGAGNADIQVAWTITSLKPNTKYHFRVEAENAKGTDIGEDQTFTTRDWVLQTYAVRPDGRTGQLVGTSCGSSGACMAVGYGNNASGVNVTLNVRRGSTGNWVVEKPLDPEGSKGSRLQDVSCPAVECIAVGNYINSSGTSLTLAERWTGSQWSIMSTPNPSGAKESRLEGVSCTSTTACTAAGFYINSSGTTVSLVEVWNGSEWTIKATPNPSGTEKALLNDVSCPAANDCWAVGESKKAGQEPILLAEHWNGSEWSLQTLPGSAKRLTSISCSSTAWCMAVGDGLNVERWNGSAWTTETALSSGESASLKGVSCGSPTACTAVGDYNKGTLLLAEHWSGGKWSLQNVTQLHANQFNPDEGAPVTSTFEDVSCELANACTAVGAYDPEGGYPISGMVEARVVKPASVATGSATYTNTIEPQLNGIVNPEGNETSYWFEYDTSEYKEGESAHGIKVPTSPAGIGSGTTAVSVSQILKGLKASTVYHFRVVAENEAGVKRGVDKSFTTLPPCKGAEAKCTWSLKSTPNPKLPPTPINKAELGAVSCPSTSLCLATGYDANSGKGFEQRWTGSEWKSDSLLSELPSRPQGIACPTTTECIAVGYQGTAASIEVWGEYSPGAWATMQQPSVPGIEGATNVKLKDVSCSSETACTAVGTYYKESKDKTLALRLTRKEPWSWSASVQTTANPESGSAELRDVSCPSATFCTAVGTRGTAIFVETWNGTSWSIASTPEPSPSIERSLEDVSCTSSSYCIAVGTYRKAEEPISSYNRRTLTERWNGTSWSIVTSPNPAVNYGASLLSVSCTSSSACIAVGRYVNSASLESELLLKEEKTLAESWNGTEWTIQSSPNPEGKLRAQLAGISCPTQTNCAAVGSAWQGTSETSDHTTLGEGYE